MKKDTNPVRNEPAEKGRDNDPDVRDRSAAQPGVNTISSSESDAANEQLSKASSGNDSDEVGKENADKSYDD